MNNQISFVASGDYLQTRRIPSYEDPDFKMISELIHKADARITNLEITISYNEGTPGAISGGTHVQTTPDRLEDLVKYGFNLVGTANNHAFDYSYDGLVLTNKYLKQYGILNTGTGENLYQAEKPVYLDTMAGRVAFISITTPIHITHYATEQRRDIKGRPGVNGFGVKKIHVVNKEDFEALKRVAKNAEVNCDFEMMIEEGYMQPLPDNVVMLGTELESVPMLFTVGENEGLMTEPDEKNMIRIEKTIDDAKRQADYVIVNYHGHDMKGKNKRVSPDYLPKAARRFIDAGADAFIGTGPHILRGIEIYRGCPIFYCLGNFIFQNETLEVLPQDFYDSHNIPNDYLVTLAIDKRTKNGTKCLLNDPEVMESIIPFWTMSNGELNEITLYPIELGYGKKRHQNGFPKITKNEKILKRIQDLSRPYGTEIKIEDGVGKIKFI